MLGGVRRMLGGEISSKGYEMCGEGLMAKNEDCVAGRDRGKYLLLRHQTAAS